MSDSIYSFDKLRNYLIDHGYFIGEAVAYKPISAGDIKIDEGGNIVGDVHLDEDKMFSVTDVYGIERKVFLIKKAFYFKWKGELKSLPKAHLCMCEAIVEHGEDSYKYANSQPVEVFDRSDKVYRSVGSLELCGYCSKMLNDKFHVVRTIDDFVEILKAAEEASEKMIDVEVDYNGYVKDWRDISEAYRVTKNYTCENCGIEMDDFEGRQYCQVHHVNGVKTQNHPSNLKCLCIECHSQVDVHHQKNFSSRANQTWLSRFKKYRSSKMGDSDETLQLV